MANHFGQFNKDAEEQFNELASEKYDFGSCKSGEKMTFGKCQKVGGSGKEDKKLTGLKQSKATAEAQLKHFKKTGNKPKIAQAEKRVQSINAKIDSYNSSEDTSEFKSGCPDGFRSQGSQTIHGKRREVCCSPDGKSCMTADGIPL